MIRWLLQLRDVLIRKQPDMPPWLGRMVAGLLDWGGAFGRKWFVEKNLLTYGGWAGLAERWQDRFIIWYGNVRIVARRIPVRFVNFIVGIIVKAVIPLAAWLGRRRLRRGHGRTLWGCTPILTLPLKAKADRMLGFESNSLVFTTYYISSGFDINLKELTTRIFTRHPYLSHSFEQLMMCWFLLRYDVFHFFYDRGILRPVTAFGINPHELDVMRAAGKRVYLYAYGADVRRREATLALGKWNFCSDCPEPGKFCICDDTTGSALMAAMCSKATQPVALGDMLAYVPHARNMHYWPLDMAKVTPAPLRGAEGPFKIAHAPNHAHFKGSHYLEATIEKLRLAGHAIDYVKVQGVPNSEVIRLFGEADLIADQFIGGAYGYTALEAMALAKPVLTYVRSPDLVETVDECPLINVTPDTLEATLLWCLENRDVLAAIGAQGRAYVERWHSVDAVARRVGQMYLDTADFPPVTARRIRESCARIEAACATIAQATGWQHPYLVRNGDPSPPLAGLAA
jgi:hypothetical protein